MSSVVGLLLMYMEEESAFWVLDLLMEKYNMKNLFRQGYDALSFAKQQSATFKRVSHSFISLDFPSSLKTSTYTNVFSSNTFQIYGITS